MYIFLPFVCAHWTASLMGQVSRRFIINFYVDAEAAHFALRAAC